jgi:hypothetical protein
LTERNHRFDGRAAALRFNRQRSATQLDALTHRQRAHPGEPRCERIESVSRIGHPQYEPACSGVEAHIDVAGTTVLERVLHGFLRDTKRG